MIRAGVRTWLALSTALVIATLALWTTASGAQAAPMLQGTSVTVTPADVDLACDETAR